MVTEGRFMYVHSWKGVCFIFSWINLKGFSVIIGMSTAMAEAAYGVMSNTLNYLEKHWLFEVDTHFIYKSIQISSVSMMKYMLFPLRLVFMVFL